MNDTPISLLKLILAEVEDHCTCNAGRAKCLHCRIKAVIQAHEPVPYSIIFFANGRTAVCDRNGNQIGKYQRRSHKESIKALEADGYQWDTLRHFNRAPHVDRPAAVPVSGADIASEGTR